MGYAGDTLLILQAAIGMIAEAKPRRRLNAQHGDDKTALSDQKNTQEGNAENRRERLVQSASVDQHDDLIARYCEPILNYDKIIVNATDRTS